MSKYNAYIIDWVIYLKNIYTRKYEFIYILMYFLIDIILTITFNDTY